MLHDRWHGPDHVGSCDGSTAHLAEAGESASPVGVSAGEKLVWKEKSGNIKDMLYICFTYVCSIYNIYIYIYI